MTASKFTVDLPQSVIETATHYDAFQLCTPKGQDILAEDGCDASLCDAESAERVRIHDEFADRLGAVLGR